MCSAGANLLRDAETDRIVEVITPNLTLSLQFVVSDHSKQSSDGGWDANVGTPADVLPEVPPNGTIATQLCSLGMSFSRQPAIDLIFCYSVPEVLISMGCLQLESSLNSRIQFLLRHSETIFR